MNKIIKEFDNVRLDKNNLYLHFNNKRVHIYTLDKFKVINLKNKELKKQWRDLTKEVKKGIYYGKPLPSQIENIKNILTNDKRFKLKPKPNTDIIIGLSVGLGKHEYKKCKGCGKRDIPPSCNPWHWTCYFKSLPDYPWTKEERESIERIQRGEFKNV